MKKKAIYAGLAAAGLVVAVKVAAAYGFDVEPEVLSALRSAVDLIIELLVGDV